MAPQSPPTDEAGTFLSEFSSALQSVRGALTEILVSLAIDAANAAEIGARLGLRKVLAWRVSKIVTSRETATAMRQMPGEPGVKILETAFEKAGAPDDRLATFRRAIAEYRRVIEKHAGDAAMLEVMLASQQDAPAFDQEATRLRQHSFRGAAAVWGAYARVQLAISVVAPTHDDDELVDLAFLGGLIDFCPLRPSIFWPIHVGFTTRDNGQVIDSSEIARQRTGLVRQFCSTPVPEIESVEGGGLRIKSSSVGQTARVSWMLQRIMPAVVSRYRDAGDEFGQHRLELNTPVELVQYDLLIHRDLSFTLPPEVLMFGNVVGSLSGTATAPDDRLRLPVADRVASLGSQPPIMSTPNVPQAVDMAKHLCGLVGRTLDEFAGYRFTMAYPPIPTLLFLRHLLMTR